MTRFMVGDQVAIIHGMFAGVMGEVIRCDDLSSLAGMSLSRDSDRGAAIPLLIDFDGLRMRIGVSPEFLAPSQSFEF